MAGCCDEGGRLRASEQIRLARLKAGAPLAPPVEAHRRQLELLVFQATPFCNINCEYCYLPNRSDKSVFDLARIDELFRRLSAADLLNGNLSVAWHAGEPLVLPADYYLEAIQKIGKLAGKVRVTHHFQTNGMLINDAYCELFKRTDVQVALSIDGPAFLHDKRRKTRSGKPTHAKAMEGLASLRAGGISCSAIAVLSRESLDYPDEIFDFFQREGFSHLGLNIDEAEGSNTASSLAVDDIEDRYAKFLRRLLQRAHAAGRIDWIREFSAVGSVLSFLQTKPPHASENAPLAIVTVGADGRIYTFSPELAGLDNGAYSLGYIEDVDFTQLEANPLFAEQNAAIQRGVAKCRSECRYFHTCGGGAPVNKLSENGSFDSTETLFCRLKKQVAIGVLEDFIVENIALRRSKRKGRAPDLGLTAAPFDVSMGGVELIVPDLADGHRCAMSRGTAPGPEGEGYGPGARVPCGPWRPLSPSEQIQFSAQYDRPRPFVKVFEPPHALIEPLRRFAQERCGDIEKARSEFAADPLMNEIVEAIARIHGSGANYRLLGLGANQPALRTVTIDGATGYRLGLHVDSWFRLPIPLRRTAPNRLCVNLGVGPRHFFFIRQGLDQVAAAMSSATPMEWHPTELGQSFMAMHPEVPVTRIRVDPGEAYIAPTEMIIHDGSSEQSNERDLCLTILGQFTRDAQAFNGGLQ